MKVIGIDIRIFFCITAVVIIASYLHVLPFGMVGSFAFMMVLGAILNLIGDKLPIIKDYFGGGPIIIIFGSAALISYNVLPADTGEMVIGFMKGEGFLSFYIASLITGSILGMNRRILLNAVARYLPVILIGVIASIALCGLGGALLGYGAKRAIFYICIPIMGGGMGAGAVPLAEIFGAHFNTSTKEMMSVMVPAVAIGNAMAIIVGGLMSKFGKMFPKLNGNGQLIRTKDNNHAKDDESSKEEKALNINELGIGLLIACTFFILGNTLAEFIPLHPYALMILSVAAFKIFNIIPQEYEKATAEWFQFVMVNLTPALLVGIGVAYTDLNAVFSSISFIYVALITLTILGAVIGTGLGGYLVGFYPLEASVTAGLCMANMGGTGDVAVLSACKRMELIPFSQISSRLGGAFMLILATMLINFV
ncbi:2-hydroxycarboxylate transporter family protein [Dongshaea marina]|uniref:2-hydroxycarboxylate transporter family protein n=1 Tax=Dongshaea marina TaxID=2047966 RepID=UPI000D3EDE7B|nr:2-hydroxycarboxylate transporter family protein [Dongshaea marina]